MLPKETLSKSISTITTNGNQLLGDAKLLFDFDRFSTALALAVLAQEEFAKAFLLQLVIDGALPWLPEIRRSMARHECKHLLALVMEWVPPLSLEEIIEQGKRDEARHKERMAWLRTKMDESAHGKMSPDSDNSEPTEPDVLLPRDVATALNIYRHEELERLRSGSPWKDEDWASGKARKIADGLLDKKKQSAFYVHVTKCGEVGLHPGLISREEASEEIKWAERLSDGPLTFSDEYRKLKELLPLVFSDLGETSKE